MLENISDYISFAVLVACPLILITVCVKNIRHHARVKKIANQEKYYREW